MTGFDAVVIGGGPAGGAAALLLARQGRRVAVVEKARFPRRKVCGEFLSATNGPLIERLGITDAFRAAAGPEIRHVALFCGPETVTAPMPAAGGTPFGRALGRDRLDFLLLEAAARAGAEVLQPWQALALSEAGAAKRLLVSDATGVEHTLTAPLIVAAHGSWEPGRLPTQAPHANGPRDHLGFKAHFSGAELAPDLMPLLVFPGGYGGMVHADAGRLSISLCIRRDALTRLRADHPGLPAGEAVERHLREDCLGVDRTLRGARIEGRWLAAGPIRPGMRQPYANDIFAIGNVAGESHPIIAEGISMALQSAWLLAAALEGVDGADAHARAKAGHRYAQAWRRQFALRIRAASLLAGLCRLPLAPPLVASATRLLPALLTFGASLSGKTRPVPGLGG